MSSKLEGDEVNILMVSLIQVRFIRGTGTENDPYREVVGYFTAEGICQAEKDPLHPSPHFGRCEHLVP